MWAPDRLVLKDFGGTLSIEEFRARNVSYPINFPPFKVVEGRYSDGVWVLGVAPKLKTVKRPVAGTSPDLTPSPDRPLDLSSAPSSAVDQLRLKKSKNKQAESTTHHDIMHLMRRH
jgi:hypothetical protein